MATNYMIWFQILVYKLTIEVCIKYFTYEKSSESKNTKEKFYCHLYSLIIVMADDKSFAITVWRKANNMRGANQKWKNVRRFKLPAYS